jgi:membrane-associated phospholipid phosphatase
VLRELDASLLREMRTRVHSPPVERAMRSIGTAAEYGAIWIGVGLAAAALDPSRRGRWLKAGALAPAAVGANFAVKMLIRRARPELHGLPPLAGAPSSLSFPSAHSTSSFAAATAMGRIAPAARGPLFTLATVIALGRPYLGMHYPSDVLAGALLGLLIGRLVPGLDDEGGGPSLARGGGETAAFAPPAAREAEPAER